MATSVFKIVFFSFSCDVALTECRLANIHFSWQLYQRGLPLSLGDQLRRRIFKLINPFEGGFKVTSGVFLVIFCHTSPLTYSIKVVFNASTIFEDVEINYLFSLLNLSGIQTYNPGESKIEIQRLRPLSYSEFYDYPFQLMPTFRLNWFPEILTLTIQMFYLNTIALMLQQLFND